MYLYELPELKNELETITTPSPDFIWDEIDPVEFQEICFDMLNNYIENNPTLISEPTFVEEVYQDLIDLLLIQFEDFLDVDSFIDDLLPIVEDIFEIFLECFTCQRSNYSFNSIKKDDNEITRISKQIEYLREIPQPVQRTPEWYETRHSLITASNAYKVFGNDSTINQIIYEKCKPIIIKENEEEVTKSPNLNSPLHWGQKYEPVSVMIYEFLHNTTVEEFGCIPHKDYSFLGASPDGIVTDKNSDRYGRMLEIKNVVNRVINGVPKKEYWIQMQLQMEVCDLDLCDFLETKFVEISDYNSFINEKITPTTHGVILYFSKNMKPNYVYKPLDIVEPSKIDEWIENTIEEQSNDECVWIRNIYWKLETISCVVVQRNKEWFQQNINQLEKVWNIILHERINGYDHRAPKKTSKQPINEKKDNNSGCLLNVVKIKTEIINQL